MATHSLFLLRELEILSQGEEFEKCEQRCFALSLEEFSCKVRDTLAGLVAAKCNANDGREKKFAEQALTKNRIRIVR